MTIKINETFCSFTGEIDVGRFSFFVKMNGLTGATLDINSIVEQAMHFPRVVLLGEPFYQKMEVAKLVKRLTKQNSNVKIEINTTGIARPVGIGTFNNIIYNINVQMKHTGLDVTDRLKNDVLRWFNEIGANFKFEVRNEDDIDEAMMIVNTFGIKKSQVFLVPIELDDNSIRFVLKFAKHLGFNIALKFHKLWPKNGR